MAGVATTAAGRGTASAGGVPPAARTVLATEIAEREERAERAGEPGRTAWPGGTGTGRG